ncbi:MAG: phage N-6-adenine-methyltransferase [Candidatus Cloacimonetes bacterium]|nr:phage N-6-adenine-methyltransferase [Candidatus Cloacimonadota bacterium]
MTATPKPRNLNGVWSSDTDEWATPDDLFNRLNCEFHFNLDVCATSDNAKCDDFFTKKQNGLAQSWAGRRVWCNPPYGRDVGGFIKKAFLETRGGLGTICVCLVAARTDTAWWQDYAMRASEIRLIRGRLKFGGAKNGAPFPSALLIFGTPNYPRFTTMEI